MNFKQKRFFKFGAIIVAFNMLINLSLPGVFAFANNSGIELNITSNKQTIEGGDRVEFTLDYQIKGGPGTVKEGDEIRFTLPEDFKDLIPICPQEHFKSVKKEGNTVIATFGQGVEGAIGGYVAIKATAGNVDSPKKEKVTVELNGVVKNLDITINPNPDEKPDPPQPPKPIDRELLKTIDGYSWTEDGKVQTVINNPAVGKTVKYAIYVNEKFAHLNNAVLTDRIPEGMSLIEDSVIVQEVKADGTSKDVTADMKNMISKSPGNLQVNFANISSEYIVKYTTKINTQKPQYENTAKLQTETGNLESSTIVKTKDDKTMVTKTSFTNDQATDENGKKQNIVSGVNDEVTYRIDVNENNAHMSDAILEDVTPNGMELVPNSIVIWEKNADGSQNEVTSSFKDKIKTENNKITIDFGNTNKGYIIGYKLKVVSRQKEYNNKAKLDYNKTSQEANSDVKYEMNAGAINAHKSVDKTEIKDGDNNIVNYSIDFDCYGYFNANYLNLTDKLDKNVKILGVQVPKEFTATVDKNTNEIKVVNDKGGIEYGQKLKVLIKTDFTNVPDGSSIHNTAKINKSTTNEVVTKKGYSISFYKVDSKDSSKKLEGAKFTLMDNNHNVISTLTSDKNGLVTSALSKPGDYYVKEVQAPNGYILNSSEVKFTVKDSDIGNCIKLQDMKNDLDVGSVVLTKVDSDNGQALQGAIFKVVDSNNKVVAENLTTDKDGKITVDNLKPGKYSFIETKAPEGYKLNSNPIAFEIVMSQKDAAKVTAKNELIPGSVVLTKLDSDNGNVLQGAIFKVVDSNNKIVAENLTTDKDGKITVDNLKPGKYSFIETKAPEGYKLNSNPVAFEIVMSQKDVAKVTAKNELIPGSVVLTKVDSDNGNTLQGAIFKVVDSNNKIVAENLTTDKEGKITVDNLKPGKYSFIETKAPEGYKLNSNPIAFEIVMSQKDVAKVTAKNELIPGSVVLTKVDSDNGQVLQGAIFKVVDSNNKIVAENLTTDKDGKITVDNLKPGKYSFIETKAPEGYKLNSNPIAFEIVMLQKDAAKVTAKNELIPGSVVLT
ncbi:MAG: SpaA isopeptide-forming pilin-related protein, partial [Clostridium sp.]|uniref:SpaA isopeptide-forming pilin-related protein n=1 Tax=Clostridium sp. TaxID=1506 RepID=UPI003F347ED0